MGKRRSSGLIIAIVLSLLLHTGLVLTLTLMDSAWQNQPSTQEVVLVDWIDLPPEIKMADTDPSVQIVEQETSINDKTPQKDYRLSLANQDVFEETKAARSGAFQNQKNQQSGQTNPSKSAPPEAQSPRQSLLDQLKPKMFDDEFNAERLAPPSEPAKSGAEVSQSDDYLEDVVVGAETLLRTREFVYYSYYNRIKSKLRQHWEPRIKEKIVKILRQGRRVASSSNQVTRLIITLDAQGELVRIQVRHASGYNDLDDAAIEAFRAAAPFPNPPDGLVDGSGKIEINWDFVLES